MHVFVFFKIFFNFHLYGARYPTFYVRIVLKLSLRQSKMGTSALWILKQGVSFFRYGRERLLDNYIVQMYIVNNHVS